MPSWSTAIVPGTDLYSSAMIQMFRNALDERRNVSQGMPAGTTWPTGPYNDPSLAPGTDAGSILLTLQSILLTQVLPFGNWLDYSTVSLEGAADLSSMTTLGSGATLDRMRVLAGLPTITVYSGSSTTAQAVVTSDHPLFRRCRPREILSTTCTRDVHGNPVFDGMKAYLVADSYTLPGLAHNQQGHGTCWKYTAASGIWARTNERPDTVDNTLAAPYVLAERSTDLPEGPNVTGQAQNGDYITSIQWEELRKLIDVLRWSRYDGSYGTFVTNGSYKSFVVGPIHTNYADTSAAATARWTATAATAFTGWSPASPQVIWESINQGYGGGYAINYAVQIIRYAAQYQITGLSTIKKNLYFYVSATSPGVFDANGDGVLNGQYHMFGSSLGDVTASPTSPMLGSMTIPDDAGDPGSSVVEKGYQVNGSTSVCKWNVAGGFNYCTVTDV